MAAAEELARAASCVRLRSWRKAALHGGTQPFHRPCLHLRRRAGGSSGPRASILPAALGLLWFGPPCCAVAQIHVCSCPRLLPSSWPAGMWGLSVPMTELLAGPSSQPLPMSGAARCSGSRSRPGRHLGSKPPHPPLPGPLTAPAAPWGSDLHLGLRGSLQVSVPLWGPQWGPGPLPHCCPHAPAWQLQQQP